MIKIFYKFFLTLFIIVSLAIAYLSLIGVETNVFNQTISKQLSKVDKNLGIDLTKISIILDPIKFKIKLKTVGTNIKYKDEKIQLESIKSDISIRSFLNKEFSLSKINISTKSLEIKNLIEFVKLVKTDPRIYIGERLIKKGYLIADIQIEFDEDGKIKDNFQIKGLVKNGKIDFFKKYNLDEIDFIFEVKKDEFQFNDLDLRIENEKFKFSEIRISKKDGEYQVSGRFINDQIDISEDKFYKYFDKENLDFQFKEISFLSKNNFKFTINEKFKIKDINIDSKINLINLNIQKNLNFEKIFPDINNEITFKNNDIKIKYNNNNLDISGLGNIVFQKKADKISYTIFKNKKSLYFDTKLMIKNNNFNLDFLNYKKKKNTDLQINIEGENIFDKSILLKKIKLIEGKNIIFIKELLLKNNKIDFVKSISLNYKDKDYLENNFQIIKKKNSYFVEGNSFSINQLINNLIKSDNKKIDNLLKNDFKLFVDLKRVYLDKENILQDLNGFVILKDGKVFKTELKSSFLDNKNVKFTVNTNGREKITTLFSNDAKPFVGRYNFIKGFDEGSLDFFSIKNENKSDTTLKIYDFKLKELPALTKLLTLASLQGIADLLSGEGIRFNEFEMKFSNKDNLMTIEEIYAIGPAISILMSGYIEEEKIISLRGTLVPATTLNKTIGTIPLLGKILVGKKTGEGVFGVSFKIKGPPGKLETTVNPIKTLTPRFITRTLEKIKKN